MAFMRHNNNGGNGRRHNHNNRHGGRPNNNGGNHTGQQQPQNGQRRNVNRINQVFDSNGPDGRIRGTAQQIAEKFTAMARDASVSGDKVLMQNYFQHAEHYQRLVNEIMEEAAVFEREREQQRAQQQASQPTEYPVSESSEAFAAATPEAAAQQQSAPHQKQHQAPRHQAPQQQSQEDDLDTLPSFVQVPISSGNPAVASSESPRPALKPRTPRRTPVPTDDKVAE